MLLPRNIIYTGPLGGTRGRLGERYHNNNGLQVLWIVATSTSLSDFELAMILSASLRFSLLSTMAKEAAKKRKCREFPESFMSF